MATNPLLNILDIPALDRIQPTDLEPALKTVLAQHESALNEMLQQKAAPTWETHVAPLLEIEDQLDALWSAVSHLHSVANSPEWREAYNVNQAVLTAYFSALGQNADLYQIYQSLSEAESFSDLSQAQQQAIKNALRDFKLSGVDLDEAPKKKLREIDQSLAELSTTFSANVLDAAQAWEWVLSDPEELAGVPEGFLDLAQQQAQAAGKTGYRLQLDYPNYHAVMSYAKNRELRKTYYTAYVTRASKEGPHAGKWDNGPVMENILQLRQKRAALLGYADSAELSLARKMCDSKQQVFQFLKDLVSPGRTAAQREFSELEKFAADRGHDGKLESWDIGYYSEQLQQEKFHFSQEDLRPYFPIDQVLSGLFDTAHRLFGIQLVPMDNVPRWHEDVQGFSVQDASGKTIARCLLDLFARPEKRGGAWMAGCRDRFRHQDGSLQLPVAFVAAEFTPATGNRPALLSHDEVITLFHEFGHAFHHMLTQVEVSSVAGTNGVAWDAVELPSQCLEQWCWQPEVLQTISQHVETGETLPEDLQNKLLSSRQFQAGMHMVRQLEFALFDFELHAELKNDAITEDRIQSLLDAVREKVSVVTPPAFNRFQHGFSHIFAGGYAAGYYSYKWAEVLASDAFSRFEEEGLFSKKAGQDFLDKILAVGGSIDAMTAFVNFRGREPSVEPLLRHHGL